jgi:hypothetical protein
MVYIRLTSLKKAFACLNNIYELSLSLVPVKLVFLRLSFSKPPNPYTRDEEDSYSRPPAGHATGML